MAAGSVRIPCLEYAEEMERENSSAWQLEELGTSLACGCTFPCKQVAVTGLIQKHSQTAPISRIHCSLSISEPLQFRTGNRGSGLSEIEIKPHIPQPPSETPPDFSRVPRQTLHHAQGHHCSVTDRPHPWQHLLVHAETQMPAKGVEDGGMHRGKSGCLPGSTETVPGAGAQQRSSTLTRGASP